jgi:hypothetical protein
MKTLKELLIELNACQEALDWAEDKKIEQVVEQCHRGDWLLWLAHKVDIGLQPLTLAKGHCANTVRHLMKDKRSIEAVDVAIAFGEGVATIEELDLAADASYTAYAAAYDAGAAAYAADTTAVYAASAAHTAVYAASAAIAAAYAAYADAAAAGYAAAYDAAADAYAATKKENQMQTADICRKFIGQLIIDKVNYLL